MTVRWNASTMSLICACLELRPAATSVDRRRAGAGCTDDAGLETYGALVGSGISHTHAFSLAEGAAHLPVMGCAATGEQIALR